MPVTALDPNAALVVVDMQKGIVSMPTVHPARDVLANAVRLVEAFRQKTRLVVLVRVGWSADRADAVKSRNQSPRPPAALPPEFFEYAEELQVDPSRDILIYKRQWGAFYGTDLDLQLRRREITNIVLCGISTSIGVESTARDAWERSYNLTFASDAMTDMVEEAHDRALRIIFPRLGEIGTVDEILAKLAD
ncbi:MAG: hydrolase [Candidatus Baltobacteraceae bacterium]